VIDSFPFDEWGEDIAGFWTFGPGDSTGTYVLTVLGILLMLAALVGFVWLEHRKLAHQAALLRSAGDLGLAPAAGGPVHGAAPSQPPLAGPSTDPGD
jgi:hypothetical protein